MILLKNILYILFISLINILLINSCDIFTTRNPENPTKNNESYLPPTSPSIVISNLTNSIKEKNPDYYSLCFTDDSKPDNMQEYRFYHTSDALAKYSSIFDFWTVANEKSYFLSLISKTSSDIQPIFQLSNSKFEVLMPDSSLFVSDYYLKINHSILSLPKEFSGSLQFNIIRNSNGMWFVKRWVDNKLQEDTIKNSWSILKAEFSN